jgi:hypothetical protein
MSRQEVKSCLSASMGGWKSDGVDHFWYMFFLVWWPLLFSLEWWSLTQYGMYGSLVICR